MADYKEFEQQMYEAWASEVESTSQVWNESPRLLDQYLFLRTKRFPTFMPSSIFLYYAISYCVIQIQTSSTFSSHLSSTNYLKPHFSQSKLKQPLLRRDPATRYLIVNVDPDLLRLIREVKYLSQLGFSIPEGSMAVFKKV